MTCDGKTITITEREMRAILLANGGEPDHDSIPAWHLGTMWLAMTDTTAFRWCNGEEEPPCKYADVAASMAAERERWYA